MQSVDMRRKDQKIDLTEEELQNFQKQMDTNPEFKALFLDYMKEISNPDTLKANEEYLRELESKGQLDKDQVLCKPEPSFCIRVKGTVQNGPKLSSVKKCFINICFSPMVKDYSQEKRPQGMQLKIPQSTGAVRQTLDNTRQQVPVLEVVFGQKTITAALLSDPLKKAICEVAVEAAEKRLGYKFEGMKYDILTKAIKRGGDPPMMMMNKEDVNEAKSGINITPAHKADGSQTELSAAMKAMKTNASSEKKQKKKNNKNKKNKKKSETPVDPAVMIQEIDDEATIVKQSKEVEPRYELIHRGTQENSDFEMPLSAGGPMDGLQMQQGLLQRPVELIVRIFLPLLTTAASCELDVRPDRLLLVSKDKYRLSIKLPYDVDAERNARAKFTAKRHMLEVTLKVLPPSDEEIENWKTTLAKARSKAEKNMVVSSTPAAVVSEAEKKVLDISVEGEDADYVLVATDPLDPVAIEAAKQLEASRHYVDSIDDDDDVKDVNATDDNEDEKSTKRKKKRRSVSFSLKTHHGQTQVVKPGDDSELPHVLTDQEKRIQRHQAENARRRKRKARKPYRSKTFHKDTPLGKAPNFTYSETDAIVSVVLGNIKNSRASDMHIEFDPRSVTASFSANNVNYYLKLDDLVGAIVPANCSVSHQSKNIVVTLTKAEKGLWHHLEECELMYDSGGDSSAHSTPQPSPILLPFVTKEDNPNPVTELVLPASKGGVNVAKEKPVIEVVSANTPDKKDSAKDAAIASFLAQNDPANKPVQSVPVAETVKLTLQPLDMTEMPSFLNPSGNAAATSSSDDPTVDIVHTALFELD